MNFQQTIEKIRSKKTDEHLVSDWMRSLFGETKNSSTGRFHRDPFVFPDLICIAHRSVYRDRTTIRTSFFPMRQGIDLALDRAPYEIRVTFLEFSPYLPDTEFEFVATNGLTNAELLARLTKYLMIAKLRS